ncbi:MAG: hypothetical protein VW964_02815 [Ilumatobacter sp.]
MHPTSRRRTRSQRAAPAGGSGSLEFAGAVKVLGAVARSMGLEAPGFRSPPRLVGVDRSVRRRRSTTGAAAPAVVSVRVRDRPWPAVLADMVEGVVVANGLVAPEADRARSALWESVAGSVTPAAGAAGTERRVA